MTFLQINVFIFLKSFQLESGKIRKGKKKFNCSLYIWETVAESELSEVEGKFNHKLNMNLLKTVSLLNHMFVVPPVLLKR